MKVADTTTPIPEGAGTFTEFGTPSIGGGTVAFRANGPDSQRGVYTFADGSLTKVADTNTPAPGGAGNFTFFGGTLSEGNLSVASDGTVAFLGQSGAARLEGIYTNRTGPLTRVIDETYPVPFSPGGTWVTFNEISHDGGQVAFTGLSTGSLQGVYLTNGASLSRIADTSMGMPGTTINFSDFGQTTPDGGSPSLHAGDVAFVGIGGDRTHAGVYVSRGGGALETIADLTTLVPGTTETFTRLADPDIRDGQVVFGNHRGIYLAGGGGLTTVARATTEVPESDLGLDIINFLPALDGGAVVYNRETWFVFVILETQLRDAIVTNLTGPRRDVANSTLASLLGGRRVETLFSGKEALSEGTFVFKAIFRNGSQAIYIARPR